MHTSGGDGRDSPRCPQGPGSLNGSGVLLRSHTSCVTPSVLFRAIELLLFALDDYDNLFAFADVCVVRPLPSVWCLALQVLFTCLLWLGRFERRPHLLRVASAGGGFQGEPNAFVVLVWQHQAVPPCDCLCFGLGFNACCDSQSSNAFSLCLRLVFSNRF